MDKSCCRTKGFGDRKSSCGANEVKVIISVLKRTDYLYFFPDDSDTDSPDTMLLGNTTGETKPSHFYSLKKTKSLTAITFSLF